MQIELNAMQGALIGATNRSNQLLQEKFAEIQRQRTELDGQLTEISSQLKTNLSTAMVALAIDLGYEAIPEGSSSQLQPNGTWVLVLSSEPKIRKTREQRSAEHAEAAKLKLLKPETVVAQRLADAMEKVDIATAEAGVNGT